MLDISGTSHWQWVARRRSIALLFPVGMVTVFAITLLWCYSLVTQNRHKDHISGFPAISDFGDQYPEHVVFAAGIVLSEILLCLVIWFRGGQLAAEHGRIGTVDWIVMSIGWLGALFLCVMACISESSDISIIHFIGAAFGVVFLALHILFTTTLAIFRRSARGRKAAGLQLVLDIYTFLVAGGGLIIFCVWISDLSFTQLEWAGGMLVLSSILPYFYYFSRPTSQYSRIELA